MPLARRATVVCPPPQESAHVHVLRPAGGGPLCRSAAAPSARLPRLAADEPPAAGRTRSRAGPCAGAGRRWRAGAEGFCRGAAGLAAAGRGSGRADAGSGRADTGSADAARAAAGRLHRRCARSALRWGQLPADPALPRCRAAPAHVARAAPAPAARRAAGCGPPQRAAGTGRQAALVAALRSVRRSLGRCPRRCTARDRGHCRAAAAAGPRTGSGAAAGGRLRRRGAVLRRLQLQGLGGVRRAMPTAPR